VFPGGWRYDSFAYEEKQETESPCHFITRKMATMAQSIPSGSQSFIEPTEPTEKGTRTPESIEKGAAISIEAPQPASPPDIPNGGLQAWSQVAGSFFLFFNSW